MPDRPLPISHTRWQAAQLRVALLLVPFALLLAAFKLVQVGLRYRRLGLRLVYDEAVRGLIAGWFVPLVGFAVLFAVGGVLGWRAVRRRRPQVKPRVLLAALGVLALIGAELSLWIGFGAYKGVVPRLWALFRWDALFLLCYALFGVGLLGGVPARGRPAATLCFYALTWLLMTLAALEFGYYLGTGSVGDFYLLQYAVLRFGQVYPSLLSEVRGWNLALLAIPLACVLAAALLARRGAVRRWALTLPENPWQPRRRALLVGGLLLLLAVPPRTAYADEYAPFSSNAFVRIFGAAFAAPRWAQADFEAFDAAAPPFDTKGLRLVPEGAPPAQNLVLILLESTRARSVAPYNRRWGVTPFLDSLAARALVAEQMYSTVPYTADALVGLLHGIYPKLTGEVYYAGIPFPALPALLKPHGYRSAFFSSAILRVSEGEDKLLKNMGFDVVLDGAELARDGFERLGYSGYEEHVMLEPGMQWIDEGGGRPFFVVFQTQAPHHDFRTPSWFTPAHYTDADAEFDRYLNTLRYVDGFVADLFAAFEERGLGGGTTFVLVGDHGEAFGEHGFRYHANAVWEEVVRVPLLIYAPGRVGAGTIAGAREHADVLPTVADLLGLRAEGGVLPGRSMLGPVPDGRPLFFSAAAPNQFMALREGDLKYVYSFRRSPMQVYDLAADSLERHDLAGRFSEQHLEDVELRLLLWRRQVNARYDALPDEQ